MSHIRCHLCGKDSAISSFNPSNLDRDIYIRQTHGRGYRGGFSYDPDESVLGDEFFTPMIKARCFDLIRLFIEKKISSPQEVIKELKIDIPIKDSHPLISPETLSIIQTKLLEDKVSSLKKQVSSLSSSLSISHHESSAFLKKYEDLKSTFDTKKRVENVLRWLHTKLDSEIVLEKEEWVLHLKEQDFHVDIGLGKKLYKLSQVERDMIENRIISGFVEHERVFSLIKNEPVILSEVDAYMKNPNEYYYLLQTIPLPWDHENRMDET